MKFNSEMFFNLLVDARVWAATRKVMGDQPMVVRARVGGVWGWLVHY